MRHRIRPLARLGTLVTVVAAVVLMPGTANAGGPTSVLLVSPQHQQTASLYRTDQDYDRLTAALGPDPTPDPGAPTHANVGPGGQQITVTWLIHDVTIWRVDRILLGAEGGPWINTHMSYNGKVNLSKPGIWHRSPAPEKLVALMNRLGLTDGAVSEGAVAAPESELQTSMVGAAAAPDARWASPLVVGAAGAGARTHRRGPGQARVRQRGATGPSPDAPARSRTSTAAP